jgi:hypothetical protein
MSATFRATSGEWAYLKLKDSVGRALFDGLVGPRVETWGAKDEHERRRGVHLLGSTQNLVDEVVVEMRFTRAGEIAPAEVDGRLYHSLEANRRRGDVTYEGGLLRITGDAAAGLGQWIAGIDAAEIVLRVVDAAEGIVRLESPRPARVAD